MCLFAKITCTRRICFGWLISVGFVTSLVLYGYQLYLDSEDFYNPTVGGFNYFLEAVEQAKLGYVVHTTNCRILNISAYDKTLLSAVSQQSSQPVDCAAGKKKWTYVEGQNLVINTTNLAESGHSFDSIDCCFVTISRVDQDKLHFDENADKQIEFSENCDPLTNPVTLITTSEFIRVRCKGKYFPYSYDILYRQFHALALPFKNDRVKHKIDHWSQFYSHQDNLSTEASQTINKISAFKSHSETPPNVVLLGIDSMSRLGFRRNMKKTKAALEDIGAVEMFGYTKVGENTFPNSVAFLSGYSEDDLQKICYYTRETPQDSCPYAWKMFSKANYLTAVVEDTPLLAGFNYLKTGFVEQPVDFYFRPFMLSLHKAALTMSYLLDCIGYRTVDEMLLQYIGDLLKMSSKVKTPVLIYSWFTNIAHNYVDAAQYGDDIYANFIKSFELNNTVLFFMSDHGYRYGKIRETFAGWYEDKLPNFWVYLPPSIKSKYPNWAESLRINSNRLASPFDLYKTLQHIIVTFSSVSEENAYDDQNGNKVNRTFGQSLFDEIHFNRTCEESGIANSFCACNVPKMLPANHTDLKLAAQASLLYINRLLPSVCTNLSLASVSGGAVFEQIETQYVVDFYAIPGNFLFEATVTVRSNNNNTTLDNFIVDKEILRMNKISTDVSCVSDATLERPKVNYTQVIRKLHLLHILSSSRLYSSHPRIFSEIIPKSVLETSNYNNYLYFLIMFFQCLIF